MLLYEQQVPDDIIAQFGRVLFGDFKGEREEDTELEKEYFQTLRIYDSQYDIMNYKQVVTSDLIEDFKYLLSIKNDYDDPEFNDVLDPFFYHNYKAIYRGLSIKGTDYISGSTKINFSKLKQREIKGAFDSPYPMIGFDVTKIFKNFANYKPRLEVESWTVSPELATKFTGPGYNIGRSDMGLIIEFKNPKKIEKELLFEPSFADRAISVNYNQQQILRISKKKIKCNVWYMPTRHGNTDRLAEVVNKHKGRHDIIFTIDQLTDWTTIDDYNIDNVLRAMLYDNWRNWDYI